LQELRDGIAKSGKPAKPFGMLPMVTSDRPPKWLDRAASEGKKSG
jgi:hypothetical protein